MSSFGRFLSENKAWWITPIVIVLALVAFLILSQGGESQGEEDAPFVYDLY